MSELTLITHVYNAQEGVDQQIARWRALDPALAARLEFIVVDDFSDTPLRIDRKGLNLRQFRIEDDIDWNMPGCRNLAAIQASSPWLLFFDVDNIIAPQDLAKLVNGLPGLDTSRLYVFRRVHDGVEVEPHINTFLLSRRGFFRAGGYDEDFAGYYGFEDVMFRNLWRRHVGLDTLLTDIAFQQMHWRTTNLDRDTSRNDALVKEKVANGMRKPKSFLRFAWSEVD